MAKLGFTSAKPKKIKLFFGSAFGLRSFDFVEARLHLSKTKENQAFLWLCIRFAEL